MSIESRIESNKSLKALSTFGVGGNARYFISVETIEDMQELRRFISRESIPFWVVGKGSNSLFHDRGFDGMVILNKIHFLEFDQGALHVGAGYSFSLLGAQMAKKGWSGLEFATGIPGTVGGAVYMNAGANGAETKDCLTEVGVVKRDGAFDVKKGLEFSYRTSPFHKNDEIIVSARFMLEKKSCARKDQLEIIEYRMKTQPYGEKSAGCVFRNPTGASAGALIEKCGLKGKSIGDAEVSTVHGNFIINKGKASASDILELASLVKDEVKKQTGKHLEMEIRPIPYSTLRKTDVSR